MASVLGDTDQPPPNPPEGGDASPAFPPLPPVEVRVYKVPLIVNDIVALPPSVPLVVPLPPDPPAPVTSSSIFTTPVPASANDLLILPVTLPWGG